MTLGFVVAALLVLVGLGGTFLPVLPGAPLVLAGFFLAAWVDGYAHVGWGVLVAEILLAALAVALDAMASVLGVRLAGASRPAIAGALVGTVAGLFVLPIGLLVGPFLGAMAGELLARRGWKQAGRSGAGALAGFLLGGVAKLAVVLAMIGLFVVAWMV